MQRRTSAPVTVLLVVLAACAPTHTVQPRPGLATIPGLGVEAARNWLLEHTIGCELVTRDWVRPQRWQCDKDMRDAGEGVLAVTLVGDEHGVYEIDAEVSEIPDTRESNDYAASFFWNLMNLPFTGSGAPDYTGILEAVTAGSEATLAGIVWDYGRRGAAYTLTVLPADGTVSLPVPLITADPPPRALQSSMEQRQAVFTPLSNEEAAMVTVSVEQAEVAALAVGGPDLASDAHIGFSYLGHWIPPLPSLGHSPVPDPIPAYLVQLLGDPSEGFPEGSSAFVTVDARTGEVLVSYSPCWGEACSLTQ